MSNWQEQKAEINRCALTRLRKKGHAIEKSQREGATTYRIAKAG